VTLMMMTIGIMGTMALTLMMMMVGMYDIILDGTIHDDIIM
jgi:hypothetical protein